MIVMERGLTVGSKFHGYRGFGDSSNYLFTDPTVNDTFPVTFSNADALDDFLNAPNSKSGSAGQNNGVALTPVNPGDVSAAQNWFKAAAAAPSGTNLANNATTWQGQLNEDAVNVSNYQHSDQNILGIDNGRSTNQNQKYLGAINQMKSDIKAAATAMAAGAALDAGSSSVTVPASQAAPAQQAAAQQAAATYTPPPTSATYTPPPTTAPQSLVTTTTTTDYTPYIIGGVALLAVGYFMFGKKKAATT